MNPHHLVIATVCALLLAIGCDGGEPAPAVTKPQPGTVECVATFLDAQDGNELGRRPVTLAVADILNNQFVEACLYLSKNDPLPDTLSVRCSCDWEQ
ncbi:MAG: hypothetical protein IH881_19005 [Myxococcales bacterium]|nr:hypothetical protein [Myxococcales bacterium]